MSAVIGGYLKHSAFTREQLPLLENPSEQDMQSIVSRVEGKFGCVSMRRQDESEKGPYKLVLYAEPGTYLLRAANKTMSSPRRCAAFGNA